MNLVLSVCLLCVCLEISKKLRSRIHLLPFSDFQDVYFDSSFLTEIGYKTSFQLLLLWKLEENLISHFLMKLLFGLEVLLSSHTIFLYEIVSYFYL